MTIAAEPPARPVASVFRVDKFVVPPASIPAFMDRLRRRNRILGGLGGCKQNLVLTQTGGPGEFNIVILVEWEDAEMMANAKSHMDALYAQERFNLRRS